jgi:hypothetical protein
MNCNKVAACLERLETNKAAAKWETRDFVRQDGCTPPHFYSSTPNIDIYVSLHITTTKMAIAEPEINPQAVSEARTPQMRSYGITRTREKTDLKRCTWISPQTVL